MLRQYRINPMEMPTVVNIPLSLVGVELALLFVEMAPCCIKVSARSKGRAKVSDLAHAFGGGGHPLAAGFSVKATLDEARTQVLTAARNLLGLESKTCAETGRT
jgi:phosphoesterase RecJ-like protein